MTRLVLLLSLLLTGSCGQLSRPAQPGSLRNANVLLITLDTTRADRIGVYGYSAAQTPNLDRLARDGVLFEHCITPSAYTLPSHASILTGLYPPHHGVRINGGSALGESQTTLAEKLRAQGYRTGAFIGAFVLDGRWGLEQGFDHYDDEFKLRPDQRLDLAAVQRPADQVVDSALQWLQQDTSKPYFAWVHLYDAHTPYEPPEPFRARFSSGGPNSLYDGEIAFTDSQVGRLLEFAGDNTVVVIVGDHGEGLGSHGESEHGYYIYDYAVRVPLLIRLPGRSSGRVPHQVRTIDIYPTVLELVSQDKSQVNGESLLPLINGRSEEQPRHAYSESMAVNLQYGWSALYSLRTNEYKYIDAPHAELYDLKDDPGESQNRLDAMRRVARQLRSELLKIRDEAARQTPKTEEANLDQETMRMLASLGYVGGASSSTPRDEENLEDPKDKIHLFESVGYAAHLITSEKYAEAAKVLEIVLKDDPDIPQAQTLLVSAYRKTDRVGEAKTILDKMLRDDPSNVPSLIAMGEILLHEGKRDEVTAIAKRALAEDERNARAWELLAEVHMSTRDHAQALPHLRKVVEIQPKLTRSRINLAAALIGVGQLGEAEKMLNEIISDYPKFPLAYFHLALLREQQGRLAEARSAYETEVRNHPNSTVARFNLGNLLLKLGDTTGAEAQMRELIKQDPASARPYLLLARTLLSRPGQLPEVERLAMAGLERAKENDLKALGYFLLADVYSRQGRRAELQNAVRKGEHYRPQGSQGSQGPAAPQGPQGPQRAQPPQGPPGPPTRS